MMHSTNKQDRKAYEFLASRSAQVRNTDRSPSRNAVTVYGAMLFAMLAVSAFTARADAPDPVVESTTVTVVRNTDLTQTVTVSGAWQWTTHHSDCNENRFAVGWAVDWNDPYQPGNYVGTVDGLDVNVGAAAGNALNPADNNVYYKPDPPRCGVFAKYGRDGYNTGTWGPLSHTYAADVNLHNRHICVVTYDIHLGKADKHKDKPKPKGKDPANAVPKDDDLLAGGGRHNRDNSVERNRNTPLGNQCIRRPIVPGGDA